MTAITSLREAIHGSHKNYIRKEKDMYKKYTEIRDRKGVTDGRVSKDTGIPKSTFSDWKSGRSRPGVDKLYTLSKYFEVPMEYFMEGGAE